MRERLANTPLVTEQVRYIADATHALRPDASQTERLAQFFSPFADDAGDGEGDRRVHVIAMNTGMVIRFFEGEYEERFRALARTLQGRLGLRGAREADADPPWPVEVVNLDLRSLLSGTGDAPSFFERMLDRLDPAASSGLVAAKAGACASCSARPLCPVRYNLEALTMPRPRQALLSVLRQAALDPDVHLSPRNLWGFLYRLVTGGSERYDGAAGAGGPCGLVRERAATDEAGHGDWLLAGQLTEVLFDQAGAGTPWSSLAQLDPAFVTAPDLDDLHTRLTIRAELDNDPELVTSMGGQGHSLAGLALDKLASRLSAAAPRRDAAVRRAAFFATAEQQAWAATDEETEFGALLTAYERYSAGALLEGSDKESLKRLRDLVQEVFLLGVGRRLRGREYLRVSQPNARGSSELLVAADKPALAREFRVQDLIVRDAHLEAHGGSSQVIRLLGYTPRTVTIKVAGVQVVVDRRMFAFLRRVDAGQKPSVRDLAGFQALVFIGDRLGNRIAAGEHGRMELFIWDAPGERLLCSVCRATRLRAHRGARAAAAERVPLDAAG